MDSKGEVLFDDNITEFVTSKIAELCGIDCAKVELAKYNGKLGSLSYDFKKDGEILIEGTVLIDRLKEIKESREQVRKSLSIFDLVSGNREKKNKTVNIQYSYIDDIFEVLDEFGLGKKFVDTILFDALIANKDRNPSNYGILYNELGKTYRLAPLYDNGSSLRIENIASFIKFKNEQEEIAVKNPDQKIKITKAVTKRFEDTAKNSKSKILRSDLQQTTHYDLVKYVFERYPEKAKISMNIINDFATSENISAIFEQFDSKIMPAEQKQMFADILAIRKDEMFKLQKKYSKENKREKNFKGNPEIALCM
jgi:hypothetical protein